MKTIKNHYHWIIAAVALLQLLIYGGAVNNFTSYHINPVTEALDISKTAFSLAGSFRGVVGLFSTLMTGTLIQRLGYRKTAALGLAASGLAYILLSTMRSYWMLAAGCGLIGLASGICATSGVSRLVNLWFHRFRGTILGLVTAATGVGSTLLGLAQTAAIENVSWRLSFVIVAGLLLLSAVLVYLFVRNTPDEMGLKPLGWGQQLQEKEKKTVVRWEGFTMGQLKRSPALYLLCICTLLSVLCVVGTQYNLKPYFEECGMKPAQAGRIYGVMMLVLGGVKLLTGVLCDLFTARRVTIGCHIACVAGLLLVILLPKTELAMLGAAVVYDFSIPLTTMIFPLLSVELFGYQAQNQFIGPVMAMISAASILSGPISSAVRDVTHTYTPAFVGAAVLSAAVIGLYAVLYVLVAWEKKKLLRNQSKVQP